MVLLLTPPGYDRSIVSIRPPRFINLFKERVERIRVLRVRSVALRERTLAHSGSAVGVRTPGAHSLGWVGPVGQRDLTDLPSLRRFSPDDSSLLQGKKQPALSVAADAYALELIGRYGHRSGSADAAPAVQQKH